jgi:DNA/RNA-binding domain of Phe-tRNA-synthetase-like protein
VLSFAPHPLLDGAAFTTHFQKPLGEVPAAGLLQKPAPLQSSDEVRAAVRDLLRHGGYKPTGRGKPASEYLIRATAENTLASINAAVDACNVVSLHSGITISVIDLDRAKGPFEVNLATKDTAYVFNASGQTIDVEGLLCLFDAEGACANPVKDSQRTKTSPQTTRTLTVIWGCKTLKGRTQAALGWYRKLLQGLGSSVEILKTATM